MIFIKLKDVGYDNAFLLVDAINKVIVHNQKYNSFSCHPCIDKVVVFGTKEKSVVDGMISIISK